uniref:Uncharacterized protein n=1 Tax=Marseillevirus LCMAC101 TaxID=2506602 RepID=A0A481YQM3_9VIRU|nr:MAG: hypothetical protein LCMAC101_00980 [Marseillevirus LCMAC101]
MGDLEKINNFCDKIIRKNKDYPDYPDSLKSLGGISDRTKDIMLKVIKNYQKGKSKRNAGYVKSELISRFLNPSPFLSNPIKKIEGPISIYQLSSTRNPQIFYLFGDYHDKLNSCGKTPKFYTWIEDTIINSPVFIDVYVEVPYQYKGRGYISGSMMKGIKDCYIRDFTEHFLKCFHHDKKYSPCQTSRFHYTDLRMLLPVESGFSTLILTYKSLFKNQSKKEISRRIKGVNIYFDFLTYPKSIVHKRITKQIGAIEDPRIKSSIRNMYRKCLADFLKGIEHINPRQSKSKITKSLDSAFFYQICLMDFYLISRCFRSYKKKEGYSGPSLNNIIYAGNTHIHNYIKILQILGFDIVESADYLPYDGDRPYDNDAKPNKNAQCLNISKIKQPLFHQRYM